MSQIVLFDNNYTTLKNEIPSGYRGYLYVLKNGLCDENELYDLCLGYEPITAAKSFSHEPTQKDTHRMLYLMSPDSEIRPVPFYKFSKLDLADISYSEMDILAQRTYDIISDFFFVDKSFGFFCKKGYEDYIPFFQKYPVRTVSELTLEEELLLGSHRNHLISVGFNLSY